MGGALSLSWQKPKGRVGVSRRLLLRQLGHAQLFETPWTVARQAPLSVGFPRQESWSGFLFPSPRRRLLVGQFFFFHRVGSDQGKGHPIQFPQEQTRGRKRALGAQPPGGGGASAAGAQAHWEGGGDLAGMRSWQ